MLLKSEYLDEYLDKFEPRQHLVTVSFKDKQDKIQELNVIDLEQKRLHLCTHIFCLHFYLHLALWVQSGLRGGNYEEKQNT